MPTVLITGANRGIGLEFARQYGEAGWTVFAGTRTPDAVTDLAAIDGEVIPVGLDVADPASVAILSERLRGVAIDLLINNAGVYGPRGPRLGSLSYGDWHSVIDTNVFGAMRVTEAFLDHLRDGDGKAIATVTSKMGSMADNGSGGSYFYRSSKAAVNAVFRSLAIDLRGEGFVVVLLHPGWVRTDMGGPGALIDTQESVTGMRRVIDGAGADASGRWFNYDGREIPW